jgi:hypothetical protein
MPACTQAISVMTATTVRIEINYQTGQENQTRTRPLGSTEDATGRQLISASVVPASKSGGMANSGRSQQHDGLNKRQLDDRTFIS